MESERKAKRLRIVTGTVAELEEQLNGLLNDYTAVVWSFAPVGDEMHGTVVLLHSSLQQRQVHVPNLQMRPI